MTKRYTTDKKRLLEEIENKIRANYKSHRHETLVDMLVAAEMKDYYKLSTKELEKLHKEMSCLE